MTALKAVAAAVVLFGAASILTAQNSDKSQEKSRVLVVSLEDRKLALVEDGQVLKVFPVAVGKPSTPSPQGDFTIERRVKDPVYHHDGKTVQPGPGNPVGTRWMGLSIRGYGIHGTNAPRSIGKAASHGCIRMAKADLEELYGLVQVGDKVELIGQRNEETAQLFGAPDQPVTAPQPTMLARTAPPQPEMPQPLPALPLASQLLAPLPAAPLSAEQQDSPAAKSDVAVAAPAAMAGTR
ncbi:MAG TPA: L,D-transpeptidase [Terracidiphilus sp.]|jgi:hypothetical protein|nr:L,D-transpeptidase [Terracidiphilus sp.]